MIKLGPIKIAAIYVLISLLWIAVSDQLLFLFKARFSPDTFFVLNSAKGFVFVLSTGFMLYLLIKRSNTQLFKSEYEYHDLFKSNPNPMWIYDIKTLRFLSVNEAAIDFYGYSREEFLAMTIKDIRPTEDHEKLIVAVNQYSGYRKSGTWRHIKKNKEMIFVNISSYKIQYQKQEAVIVLARDITESIRHEQELQLMYDTLTEEKKRLTAIQELTKIAGWEYDIANEHLIISDELLKILNVDRDQLKVDESFLFKIIYHENEDEIIIKKDITVNPDFDLDVVHRVYSGTDKIQFFRQLGKIDYQEGKPFKIRGTLQDITELKVIELERNRFNDENKRLGAIITKINNMVVVVDNQNRIIWVNRAYEVFTGYTLDEVLGLIPSTFMHGPETNIENLEEVYESQRNLHAFSVELINYTKNNTKYWVNIEFTPIFDGDGKFTGYITVHNNITTLKEKEEEITKQNVVLKDVAWLSSHEIRRPVASILGLMQLSKSATNQVEKDEYMNLLNECTNQLDQIIRKINDTIYNEQEKKKKL